MQDSSAGCFTALLSLGTMGGSMCCFGIFYVGMFVIMIAGLALWVWMLIDCAQRKEKDFPNKNASGNEKVMWILIIALTSYIGAGIYYFLVYRKMGKAG